MDYNNEFKKYYSKGMEKTRLDIDSNKLEKIRTLNILERYLPKPPAIILDIGGGAGIYSFELASLGYELHFIDIIPLHVSQVQESNKLAKNKLKSINLGDARLLKFPNNFADIILLFGPLYHLTSRKDRVKALKEAYRVLKQRGLVFTAGISRYASLIDGFDTNNILDEDFISIVKKDLLDGQHRNPTNIDHYFTTAYFHHPEDLRQEHIDAGFNSVELLSIEGPLGLLSNIGDYLNNSNKTKVLLEFMKQIEKEKTLIGASSHIMAIAKKI